MSGKGNIRLNGVSRPYSVKTIDTEGSVDAELNVEGNYYSLSADDNLVGYEKVSGFMPDRQAIRVFLDINAKSQDALNFNIINNSDTIINITIKGEKSGVKLFDRSGNEIKIRSNVENVFIYY